ncbi:MAG: hypothetical protein AAF703_10090 [Cyanobacteria bacterium P01_D01_bin.105]
MKQAPLSHWLKGIVLGGYLSLLCAPMALAQSGELTRAEVYRLQNIVDLLLRNQSPRPARIQDILAPRDAMQTGSRSRAELLFNEGSVARIGSNSVFRFVPGTRRYQLPDGGSRAETILQLQQGVAMVVSPTGGEALDGFGGGDDGETVLLAMMAQTPDAQLSMSSHTVALIVVKPGGTTFVSLTDGLSVSDLLGNNKISLQGGQTVTVKDGVFGPVESFDLRQLYRTSQLTSGLGPDQEEQLAQEPEEVQATLREARRNTLSAVASQASSLQGLCTLNARGGDSTLSSNCVTTSADDPLSEFEDRREDTAPPPIEDPGRNDPGPNIPGPNTPGTNIPGTNIPGPNNNP